MRNKRAFMIYFNHLFSDSCQLEVFKILNWPCSYIQAYKIYKSANMQIEGLPQQVQDENQRLFTDYLSRQPITNYHDFTFDIDTFRSQYPQAAQQVIKDPSKYYVLIKKFLEQNLRNAAEKNKQRTKVQRFDIKIEGNLGANFVTPRGLSSRMANQLVGLQGIITKMDITQHYLQKSVQYCPKTKAIQQRQYPDSFNPEKDNDLNRNRYIKNYDDQNNPLEFEYGLSSFKNSQLVVIQELPEMAPPGLLPMSVQVVLQSHLVNSVKPGDRVQMIGIYKLITGLVSKQKGIFRPFFICLSIKPLITVKTSGKYKNYDFKGADVFDLFSRSIAPSIWGHQYLKKAVLLMLVGGVEKNLDNGTHLRGDINLLMIGDPGTAKSQMLRWVLSTVDVSVGTTGSGASGVGLTAAIVADKFSGQKTLQAGAMVLADRGVVCIDQFDKMNQIDRVAVHEVMQQQTVTIAKAGLHCSLNARCSVIAAANPIYGQYQKDLAPTKNIGMPDSLLSRFDLIFLIFDQKKPQRDHQIAQKVCRNHRLAPKLNDFLNQYMDAEDYIVNPIEEKRTEDNNMFETNNVYKAEGKEEILTQSFLKSYINEVKQNVIPQLSDEAVSLGASLWNLLRQRDLHEKDSKMTKVLPVTIRTHESLIRLSTAHAKLLKMPYVEVHNVIQAFRLIVYCLYSSEEELDKEIAEILMDLGINYDLEKKKIKKTAQRIQIFQEKEEYRKMEAEDEVSVHKKIKKLNIRTTERQADQVFKKHVTPDIPFTKNQKSLVFKKFSDLMRKKKGNQKFLTVNDIFTQVKSVIGSRQKLEAILKQLQQVDNKIGTQNGKIFAV